MSDDFREIGASGAYFGLAKVLENLPLNARNWSAVAQNFECRELSDTIAQLVYQCVISHDTDNEPVYSLRSSIWRLKGGQWKMVFHQGTEVLPFDIVP
ncbi:MAG: nuclear transport factor 2 family protein [Anaerolineae bacterium]|nr:nuclear transport factor 2 family protein [Anaerolineae bacterium]